MVKMKYTAHQYACDVRDGKIIACKWLRLAVKRYFRDLAREKTEEFPYYFDQKAAKRKIRFYGLLKHIKGELAGKPIELQPWQQFIFWNLYGWKKVSNGKRRFKTCFIIVPRGNGKSIMASGVCIDGLVADGEGGPEIVAAATKEKQAKIVWSVASQMLKKVDFKDELGITLLKKEILVESKDGIFDFMGRDSKTEDGRNTHIGVIDEYHEHPTPDIKNVLRTSMGKRLQPILFIITTAGFDITKPCKEEQDYLEHILNETVQDETYFGMIYTIDEGDDWTDESSWFKANPNLGISIDIDELRGYLKQALVKTADRLNFLTKYLNVWTNSLETWLDYDQWKKNNSGKIDEAELEGRKCVLAFDLAENGDVSHLTYCFPPVEDGEKWKYIHRAYMSKEGIREKAIQDRADYINWAKAGWITLTPGRVTDYDFIISAIVEDSKKFEIVEIVGDHWRSRAIQNALEQQGFDEIVEFDQSMKSMSPASKDFERKVLNEDMEHGKNPLMDFYITCLAVYVDANENIKPMKKKKKDPKLHIDGIITTIMATDRAQVLEDEGEEVAVW